MPVGVTNQEHHTACVTDSWSTDCCAALTSPERSVDKATAERHEDHLLHGIHEASVLRTEAHKVDWQVQVIHVVGDPGVGRQLLPVQPIVQDHHTALHPNTAHIINTADVTMSASAISKAHAVNTADAVNRHDAITTIYAYNTVKLHT